MGQRRNKRGEQKRPLTINEKIERASQRELEQMLQAHDAAEPPDGIVLDHRDGAPYAPSAERQAWVRHRLALVGAIRRRQAKALRDPGRDHAGNYDVHPHQLAHGHKAGLAPPDLRASPESSFPRRIETQRYIDRCLVRGHLSRRQHQAAERFLSDWTATGRNSLVSVAYAPRLVDGGTMHPERRMIGRTGAVIEYEKAVAELGRLERACVQAVVIEDMTASDWARSRGVQREQSAQAVGTFTLRAALDTLSDHYGY